MQPELRSRLHRLRPGTHREPNNISGREMCGGANATQAYEGLWGWADANCDLPMPYICELSGGWHMHGPCTATVACPQPDHQCTCSSGSALLASTPSPPTPHPPPPQCPHS
jgi:hypothetical protein